MMFDPENRGLGDTLFLSAVYPPLLGGTSNKFSSRCSFFPPERITVLTSQVEGSDAFDATARYRILRAPLEARGIKGFEWWGVVSAIVRAAIPVLRSRPYDVIECARPLPEGIAGYLLARLFRNKLILNVQGEDVAVLQNYRVERFLLKRVLRYAHLSIANSRYTEGLIKSLAGGRAGTGIVFPGLDRRATQWRAEPEAVRDLRQRIGGGPVLLTLARLQARKGHDNVVRALPKIAQRFPDVRYVVVGSSQGGTKGLADKLKQLAESLGVSKNLCVVGEVEAVEVPAFYAACDLFVMPNRSEPGGDVEGFGQVFLEAGLFRKPVIGGRSGGVPDAIRDGETGLLVDGHSVPQIADAVVRILADPEWAASLGQRGREFALTMTAEKVFADYRRLREELMAPQVVSHSRAASAEQAREVL